MIWPAGWSASVTVSVDPDAGPAEGRTRHDVKLKPLSQVNDFIGLARQCAHGGGEDAWRGFLRPRLFRSDHTVGRHADVGHIERHAVNVAVGDIRGFVFLVEVFQ